VSVDSADGSSLPEQQRGHAPANGLPPHLSARLTRAYRLLFSRTPTAEETAVAADFLYGGQSRNEQAAWADLIQILLSTNEFCYVD
jgi:hypothetical protein